MLLSNLFQNKKFNIIDCIFYLLSLIALKPLAIIIFLILNQTAFAQFDSLKTSLSLDTLSTLTNKLNSIDASARGKIDSIAQYYHYVAAKVQGLSSQYQQKVDSLSHVKLPTENYTKKLDSLQNELTAVKQKVDGKMQSIKQKATEKLNSIPLPPELQSKVLQLTSSLESIKLPSLSSAINSPIDLNSLNTSLDKIIPSVDLKGIPNVPTDLPSVNGLPDVTKNLGGASDLTSGVTDQAGALQQGANEITQGVGQANQLDKLAESQVMKMDDIKGFTDATGNLPAIPMMSEEEAKKQALSQIKEIAVDHFAGKEEVLKSAMDKISKYKQKYSSISSLSEITKRPPNPMKGKPFMERIVPGIQFQIFQKQGNFLTDFNVYAGYRVNGRLTTGIGWNQRVAYNLDKDKFNSDGRVFGPRVFGEFKLSKGFLPRAEVEVMNTLIPSFVSSSKADDRNREWVVSGLVGIKKEYRFYKNIKGTTTIMINVFHPRNKSPYPDWLNARFGFEFPIRKKTKRVG